MKHRKAILIIAAGVAFVGTSLYLYSRPSGPKHDGKTAEEWFNAINVRTYGTNRAPGGFGIAHDDPAIRELKAMGPDAVPYVLEMYTWRDSSFKRRLSLYTARWTGGRIRFRSDQQR